MPLTLVGHGTATRPIHRDGALPANTLSPSRRETIEALGIIERLMLQHDPSILVDGATVTWEQAIDTLRRFILTR